MKRLFAATRWGDRESPYIRFTPVLKSFVFASLGMPADSTLKDYPPTTFLEKISSDSNLPEGFYEELTTFLEANQLSTDPWIRIENSVGRGYLDLLQSRLGTIKSVVELVLYPNSHLQVQKIVKLANQYNVKLSVVAGRTSVTTGVQGTTNTVATNLSRLNQVLKINKDAHYVTAQTGIFGPKIEASLNHEGFTLGHFPQSFEFSCLGGWVITRGAGQNSTLYGKIENMILGLKFVTGAGNTLEIPIAPARATGPDFLNIIAGSEGSFGILTEVTLRIRYIPPKTRYSAFFFKSFESGLMAYKNLMQHGYSPSIMRLSNAEETYFNIQGSILMKDDPTEPLLQRLLLRYLESRGYQDQSRCLGIMIFEGDKHLTSVTQKNAIRFAKQSGGFHLRSSPARTWMKTRFELPFLRDPIVDHGILVETFETSVTWDNIIPLYHGVLQELEEDCPIRWAHGSHFYRNGANLYFTFVTPQEKGNEENQYFSIRTKVLNAFIKYGGMISHHHGIGRAFSNWLPAGIGEEGVSLLKGIKNVFDPKGVMNPGIFGFDTK